MFCNYSESGSMDQMLCEEFYFSSGDHSVQQSRAGCVVLIVGLRRNVIKNRSKLFPVWTSSSGGEVV